MMKNRIPEFQGPAALPEAGQLVLEDRSVAGAIVRDALDLDTMAQVSPYLDDNYDNIYAAMPILDELDAMLAAWSVEVGPRTVYSNKRLQRALFRVGSTGVHIDKEEDYIPGPLALSMRIDKNPQLKRTYIARRIGKSSLGATGELRTNAVQWLEMWPPHFGSRLPVGRFARAEQRPGDVIVIPNHPYPALHAVRVERQRGHNTVALVMDYSLRSVETAQNTNTNIVVEAE